MGTSWGARTLVATGAVAALLITPAAASAAARAGAIIQVDVAADGTTGNGYVGDEDISDDGRYVAFTSGSTNLVPGDTNNYYDVFIRDLRTGTTTLASPGIDGRPADNYSEGVTISGNGRFVAFTSYATNLVADDTNGERDVFVYDRSTAVVTRASVATGNVQLNGFQAGPSISDDGRYVSFIESDYSNGFSQEAFVHDMRTGVTTQVTRPAGAGVVEPAVLAAALSGNGRRLAFTADGNYTGEPDSIDGVYLADLTTGTTTRISPKGVDANTATIDRAGDKVLYTSNAPIDPSDTNGVDDVYLDDLTTGSTTLITVNRAGTGAGNDESPRGSLSPDGRYAGFSSLSSDLVARDTNGNVLDVFLRDLRLDRTTLISKSPAGASGNSLSWDGIPATGATRILFTSAATNLGVNPGDGLIHLFVACRGHC